MPLGRILKSVVPAAIGFATGGPVGATLAFAEADRAQGRKKFVEQESARRSQEQQQLIGNAMEFRDTDALNRTIYGNSMGSQPVVKQGFGADFGEFLGDVGRNIINPFGKIFSQVRPFISQQSVGQPALPTLTTAGGQESQSSGVTEGFVGGFGNLAGQAARFLRSPTGSIGTGLLTGIGGSMLGSGQQKIRITRKMKSQYRAVLNLAQGNYDVAADMIGVSTDFFIMVLLKRFRNDGPVVTKAALRKTKSTVRRLKSMCDMYDSLRPTATRRKAPMRRASTTLISNK